MPNNFLRDLLTGLTAILGLAGLVIMLILFGETKKYLERTYPVHLAMHTASGLSASSPVLFNGVRIGNVSEMFTGPTPTDDVLVKLNIRRDINLPRTLVGYIEVSFVGDPKLNLSLPPDTTPAEAVNYIPQDAYADGANPAPPIFVQPDSFFSRIEKPLASLTKTAESIDHLALTYVGVGEDLRALLKPRTPGEVDAGAPPTLYSVVARADASLAAAQNWLSDPDLFANVKSTVAKLDTLAGDIRASLAKIDETTTAFRDTAKTIDAQVVRVGDTAAQAGQRVGDTLTRIESATGELNAVLAKVNRGEGSLGQFVNNPDLYRSLDDAARRLSTVLDEARALLEKFKTEGLPLKL